MTGAETDARDDQRPGAGGAPRGEQRRSTRVEVDGWVNLDKPVALTSTQAVGRLKFLFNARKAGHAGTLDPLASGVLPVAFGEATKTVPIVQDGAKTYRFTVRWGEETSTDDAEGEIVARSTIRPSPAEIAAELQRFVGIIQQTPPAFSAIKIDGARAYDLARDGQVFTIAPRPIVVYRLDLLSAEPDQAMFVAECGKGAYVRAIARDLGRALRCYGHVIALRRTRVGPFRDEDAVPLDALPGDPAMRIAAMLAIQAGLAEMPVVAIDRAGAATLRRGQKLLLRGGGPLGEGPGYASCLGEPVAIGFVEGGYFVSTRIFNPRR